MDNDSSISKGQNIFLIGPMGAGKSTLGVALALRIGYQFCDIDDMIEKKMKTDIATIFSEQGEATFRRYESETLQDLAKHSKQVIATGGGIVLNAENRCLMAQSGTVVYLKVKREIRVRRMKEGGGRPLIAGQDELQRSATIKDLDHQRTSLYETVADFEVINDGDESDVLNVIEEQIK